MGCVTFLLAATATTYADPPPDDDARLEDCEGLPDRSRVARNEPVGDDAMHWVTRSGQRYLVFPHADGRACGVYPIGRAAARANGSFGGRACKVFAFQPPSCYSGGCAIALAVRGKDERPFAALLTEANCDQGVALRPIKLFPGRDSIELVCHQSSGAGWQERRLLVDVMDGAFVVLHELHTVPSWS
jgi:hypothetical protein